MQRSRTGLIAGAAVALAVVLVVVLVTVIGGDGDDGGGGPQASSSPTTAGAAQPATAADGDRITRALLDPAADEPAAVAAVQGSVRTNGEPKVQPAIAEVVAVEVGPDAVLLRWRLRSTGGRVEVDTLSFAPGTFALTTANVVLVDPAGQEEARPFVFRSDHFSAPCICSMIPLVLDGQGQELTGLYPLFSSTPSEVEVRVPGFPPITGVPVTRR